MDFTLLLNLNPNIPNCPSKTKEADLLFKCCHLGDESEVSVVHRVKPTEGHVLKAEEILV